jgi:hypothetical protein
LNDALFVQSVDFGGDALPETGLSLFLATARID